MSTALSPALERVARVRGVRAVLLVDAEDGLVVAEAGRESIDGAAAAALAGSVVAAVARVAGAADAGAPQVVELRGARGMLAAAPAGPGLIAVTLAHADAEAGLLRLELRALAAEVG